MNIYTYLKKDHAKVARLFKKIIAANSNKIRKLLFLQVKKELELHADPEHTTFYKALKESSKGKEDVSHGDKEHNEIKKSLRKLSKISLNNISKWLVQLGELKYIVEHHVEDEESNMFNHAKKVISTARSNELAMEMQQLKDKMKKLKSFQKAYG